MVTKTEREKYLDAVKSAFRYSKLDSKEVVKDLGAEIDNYIAEFPDASFEDLERVFGIPDDIAKQLIAEMKPTEVSSKIKFSVFVKKSALFVAVAVIAIVLILATSIFLINRDLSSQQSSYEVIEGTIAVIED